MPNGVHDYLPSREAELVDELSSWVRIPSVAGVPDRWIEVVRFARWLAGTLRDLGFPVVEVWSEDDAPAVYAVLVYSHHVRVSKDEQ